MPIDKDWTHKAGRLAQSVRGHALRHEDMRRQVDQHAASIAPDLAATMGVWDHSVDRASWTRWGTPGRDDVPSRDGLLGRATLVVKCLRIASFVLGGREHLLCDSDLAFAAEALGGPHLRKEWLRRRPVRPGVAGPCGVVVSVDASFLWKSTGWREDGLSIGRTTLALPHVDASHAPVAVMLATPDGGRLAVRRTDAGFVRPLLAPGGWGPLDLDRFARVASDGDAWRDDPMGGGDVRGVLVCHHEVARPEPDGRPTGRDAARRAAAEAAAIARVPTLCVIDGVVHRVTGVPVLDLRSHAVTVGAEPADGGRNVYGTMRWRLEGDMNAFTGTDPFGVVHGAATSHAAVAGGEEGWQPVGMARHDEALAYVRAYARLDAVIGTGRVAYAQAPVATEVDPGLLPEGGPGVAQVLAAFEAEAGWVTARTPGMSDALAKARASDMDDAEAPAAKALRTYRDSAGYEQVRAVLAADAALRALAPGFDDEGVVGFAP